MAAEVTLSKLPLLAKIACHQGVSRYAVLPGTRLVSQQWNVFSRKVGGARTGIRAG